MVGDVSMPLLLGLVRGRRHMGRLGMCRMLVFQPFWFSGEMKINCRGGKDTLYCIRDCM